MLEILPGGDISEVSRHSPQSMTATTRNTQPEARGRKASDAQEALLLLLRLTDLIMLTNLRGNTRCQVEDHQQRGLRKHTETGGKALLTCASFKNPIFTARMVQEQEPHTVGLPFERACDTNPNANPAITRRSKCLGHVLPTHSVFSVVHDGCSRIAGTISLRTLSLADSALQWSDLRSHRSAELCRGSKVLPQMARSLMHALCSGDVELTECIGFVAHKLVARPNPIAVHATCIARSLACVVRCSVIVSV